MTCPVIHNSTCSQMMRCFKNLHWSCENVVLLCELLKSLHVWVWERMLGWRIKNSRSMSSAVQLSEYESSFDRAAFSCLWSAIYQVCVFTRAWPGREDWDAHSEGVYMCVSVNPCVQGEKGRQTDRCACSLSAWSEAMVWKKPWSIIIDDSPL